MNKLMSRKFWISVAAFLASIGTSIAGFAAAEPTVAAIGIFCSVFSAAIYAAAEAYVDGAAASANTTTTATNKTITATSTANSIVEAALQSEPAPTVEEKPAA